MPRRSFDETLAVKELALVHKYLRAGHPPPGGVVLGNHNIKGAIRMAAEELGIHEQTLRQRIGTNTRTGAYARLYGLRPDWSLFVPPAPPNPKQPEQSIQEPTIHPHDRRFVALQDEVRRLTAALKEAHRAAEIEEIIKTTVGRVVDAQVDPPKWLVAPPERAKHKPTPEVPVTIWSDWHVGETIEKAEVNGYNQFNMAIAEERVHALIDTTIDLCRHNHTGVYPGIVANLLGDFVSGGIQPELRVTDEEDPIPASIKCISWQKAGLKRLADEFKRVYVPFACGNHGRTTVRPEFKKYYRKNFDWLIASCLATQLEDDKRIVFDIRPSNDVHYKVYNERYLACHGDMLGVKGGDGMIGSIGPIVRGEIKQQGQSFGLGLGFDMILMGHWHQRLWLPRAIVNNALKGFDEYSMKQLGARPDRATQALWFVHPSRGKTASWDLHLDAAPKAATEWVSWKEKIT